MVLWTVIATTANSITAFVLNEVDKNDYPSLAKLLMNKEGLNIQQVGFVKPPIYGGKARLEMMGEGLCVNALLSFGLYIATKKRQKSGSMQVEISGANSPLSVQIDGSDSAITDMPLPVNQWKLLVSGLGTLDVVEFEGVSHVIVPDLPANGDIFTRIKKAAVGSFPFNVLGAMFLDRHTMVLQPTVYVPATDSIILKKSCGSGCAAVGVWLSGLDKKEGESTYRLTQPGGVLNVTVMRKGSHVTNLRLGGSVTLTPARTISV